MEEWQIEHITQNLKQLTELTHFNSLLTADLMAKNIFSKADVEKLDAITSGKGNLEASKQGYQMLMTRKHAYKVLYESLVETRQSGAYTILVKVPNDILSIEVQGKTFKIKEFFPTTDNESLQQIFRKYLTGLEFYDIFVTEERKFVLANNSVPPKPAFYVPRFLSNRIKIDESIFKADCPDVFVFKKTLARHKLSTLAQNHFTDTSFSQLHNITCRFIHLDKDEDWSELKKASQFPIHLINYKADQHIYLLEDSSEPSDILRKLGSKEERVYMSEEEFVQQQLSVDCTSSSVCICDTPGMGKTLLLANIARLMANSCAGRIVVFIQLTSFVAKIFPSSTNTTLEPEKCLGNVLSCICPYMQNPELLLTLVKAEILRVEIFFDGFDEIPNDQVKWTQDFFQSIIANFPNVRIYITSRPHMRQELENSLRVVAYDILPFNQQNQIDFLVQFWQNKNLDSNHLSLQTKASKCLKVINKSLSENEKKIAGIPLLCLLIAEVYSDKVNFRSIETGRLVKVSHKISGMYQKFIENKIKLVSKDQNDFDNIKIVLTWNSLKLLFPTNGFLEDKDFTTVNDLTTSLKILKVGILLKQANGTPDFIHRTFAEYLVAEYFFTKLMKTQKSQPKNCDSMSILKLLLNCQMTKASHGNNHKYNFDHPVIVSFFNSAFVNDEISEEWKVRVAAFISSISDKEFICALCACCQHNLVSIFSLLMQTLTKWDHSRILEYFTDENSYKLLSACIRHSTSQMFRKCINILKEVLKLDLEQINTFIKDETLFQIAIKNANYEAVEYLVNRISLKNQSLLQKCVEFSYRKDDIEKREDILHLLLKKDSTLIHETSDILIKSDINVRLFKMLIDSNINRTNVDECGSNIVMYAARYMLPIDFHELVQFLLTDCNAGDLFLDNEKWKDPLQFIVECVRLLPETLERLLNIPGIDINIKDKHGNNLLFSAAKVNKVENFQQLVERGLDFNARGYKNRNLLHAAAWSGGVEMVRHLLSLKLDPNSLDEDKCTPLHYVAQTFSISAMEILVENGANVKAKNSKGETALHISANSAFPHTKMIKYLIGKGLGVNDRDNEGNTPLHLCKWARVNAQSIMAREAKELLVEMGADILAENKMGQTPAQKNPSIWN